MLESTSLAVGYTKEAALIILPFLLGLIPGMWKDWRTGRDKVVRQEMQRGQLQQQVTDLVASLAAMGVRMDNLEGDLDGVAAATRTRLKLLEAIFEERTGQLPAVASRDSGEQEAQAARAERRGAQRRG